MTNTQRLAASLAPILLFLVALTLPGYAENQDSAEVREARWQDIEKAIFNNRTATPDDSIITLNAPPRAEDASLVPMTIRLKRNAAVKELYLVVDDNPSPVAAHYIFGPAADPHLITMRVRVNSYTNVHAVAELQDGSLIETKKFVRAAGGCSAPMGMSDEEAKQGMGDMRMKFAGDVVPGEPAEATLMLRHPNFNGMQMNLATRSYSPVRYIESIQVNDNDQLVFKLETSISLSANPAISFGFIPQSKGPVTVTVHDSARAHWKQSFIVPAATN
jgi:sulfur-oxidizing protein SoxY